MFTTNNSNEKIETVNSFVSDLLTQSEVIPEGAGLFHCELSGLDFMQKPEPREWVIDGLFSVGSLNVVYGESGSKKTWAMLDLAICVALGKNWLDRFKTKQGTVLYVDEESGVHRMKERTYRTINGHNILNQDGKRDVERVPFIALVSNAADFTKADWITALSLKIQLTNARLVIIDTLAGTMSNVDENAVEGIQNAFQALRRVAEHTGAAIVIIHHANKSGGYRGTSAIKAAVDVLLQVDSKDGNPNIDFKTEKARDTEPMNFAARANFGNPEQFYLSQGEAKGDNQRFSKAEKYVLSYLDEHGEGLKSEIQKNADADGVCTSSAARDAIYNLVATELIERTDEGGKGRGAIYELTTKGKEAISWL